MELEAAKQDEKIQQMSRKKPGDNIAIVNPLEVDEKKTPTDMTSPYILQPKLGSLVIPTVERIGFNRSSSLKAMPEKHIMQDNMIKGLRQHIEILKKETEHQQKEIINLKQTKKVCVFNELDMQLEIYQDECKRLREKLEEAITQ